MFKSGLTKGIYDSFLRSYQLNRSLLDSTPFIYVDPEFGDVKYLTNLMSSKEVAGEIFAVSIGSLGNVVVLSTEN
jgi:hypothetical protein